MLGQKILVEGFGGERYAAFTHAQVVDKMRASSWGGDVADGNKEYMIQIGKRVNDWCGRTIRTDKSINFLEDLSNYGLVRYVKEDKIEAKKGKS